MALIVGLLLGSCSSEDNPPLQATPTATPRGPLGLRQVAIFQLRVLCGALLMFRVHVGRFPTDREGVAVLWEEPAEEESREKWRGPYVTSSDLLIDPWGRPFAYRIAEDGEIFDLRSVGADGVISSDDIVAKDVAPDFFKDIKQELAHYTPGPVSPKPRAGLQ